ncbi:protein DDI1 2-like isoform X1 [Leptotrombidium deliense]|uniref:Protein DDI1 2-like isoform X1 n=1 Tax=Leptotrombidium deliense TaxID=299467 RepID=A0A443SQB9_9ACAR|nr:protein DDI1 2-like isoform X1 [Leptotrombidium deliense]
MGNTDSKESTREQPPDDIKGNAALHDFIEDECPVLNKAILSTDQGFRDSVVSEFNNVFKDKHFNSISDVITCMELKRKQRIEYLKSITAERFAMTPAVKFPCIAIRVNGKIAMAFVDTGCGMSCVTRRAASNIGLDGTVVSNVTGLASGFGNHTEIIGILPNIAVQSGDMLFQVTFVVIEKASADFIILGADFITKNKLKLNFRKGEVIFPRRIMEQQTVRFIPPMKGEESEAKLIIRMVENMNIPRAVGFLPHVVNQRNIFLNVRINNFPVQVMIDSGAEASMITGTAASHIKLFKFTDLSMHRVSQGLGPVVIIGRIPPIPIEFDEKTTLFISFDVLNGSEQEMIILGSDFLTFYGCEIDFDKNVLEISLDKKRSYKLREKQKDTSEVANLLKDCGLEKLLGIDSQLNDDKPKGQSRPQSTSSSDDNYKSSSSETSPEPVILKPFKDANIQKKEKEPPKDEFVDMSLESLSAATFSL